MMGKLPHRTLTDLAKTYGPIMSLNLGNVPSIVVSSPKAAELFLKTHDTVFASRPKTQVAALMTDGKGIAFTEYGPYWRNARKLCTLQLLSALKVESFGPMRRREVGLMVESLKEAAEEKKVVNISRKVGELMENMTYKMVLGRDKDDRFDLKGLVHEIMILIGTVNIADFMPALAPFDLQGLSRKVKAINKIVDEVFNKIIDEHEQNRSKDMKKQDMDFVDMMLSLAEEQAKTTNMNLQTEHAYKIDRTNIKALLLDMIAGAFDTSTTTIEWTLSELLRHPKIMMHVQEELDNVVGKERMVEETDLSKLNYLDMVIKESFRLHPVASLILHESMEEITIQGYYIPRKARILVNLWAMGRDPEVWSDVEEFKPERFVGEDDVDIRGHNFKLIPFGAGRRGCPGIQLGLTSVRLIVARLVHCFNWELPFGMGPNELDMNEQFGLTLPRAKHLIANPTYRLLC